MRGRPEKPVENRKYGMLTPLHVIGKPGGHLTYLWLCDCGVTKEIPASSVRQGLTQSCGCLRRLRTSERRRKASGTAIRRAIFTNYKNTARKEGRCFQLTLDMFTKLTSLPCAYCGALPLETRRPGSYGACAYTGLDRLDSSKGYTLDNVVPACKACNWLKRDSSVEDFLNWIKRCYGKSIC